MQSRLPFQSGQPIRHAQQSQQTRKTPGNRDDADNPRNHRNPRIDVLRGVSILLVLLHHFNIAYPLKDTSLASVMGWDAVRAVVRNGNYGVTMFFVISGFLITSLGARRWRSLANIRAAAFYRMRAARILPCLILLLVCVNVLAGAGIAIFGNRVPTGTPPSLWLVNLASLTFWMNVLITRHGWVNYALGVLWSLSVEEVFYLAFPLLCLVLRREWLLALFWVCIAAVGPWYRLAHQGEEEGFLYAYFACFDGIAIGCCAALLARRVTLQGAMGTVLQVLVAAAMTVLYLYAPIGESNVFGVTGMALGTAVLLLGAQHRRSGATRTALRPWAALGRLSYELYLFHLIVLGLIRTIFPPQAAAGNEKLTLLMGFLALSAGLGALIARFYSEPLNRRIRKEVI
jgi:peptidoglycan/LPS O-acetylase OafA/YrhL